MSWSGRQVVVTGGEGFIGSHLAERLVGLGARVRVLALYNFSGSRGWLDESEAGSEVEVVFGDVRDRDSLGPAFAGVDTVFHLAALIAIPYSYDAPVSYLRTNAEGTLNVLRAAQDAGASLVVHTSTSEVYGTARAVPIDETHPLQAQSPYAASKIAADKVAEAYSASYGLPVATVRPFNTYGPRQSARAVIPTIASQLLAGRSIELGNVTPTRDFTYVTDTAAAFVAAAETPEAAGRVLNVGSGREISVADLAARLAAVVGSEAQIERSESRMRPEASEVERLLCDASQARSVLGWAPAVSLDEGLAATVEWIRAHARLYDPSVYAK